MLTAGTTSNISNGADQIYIKNVWMTSTLCSDFLKMTVLIIFSSTLFPMLNCTQRPLFGCYTFIWWHKGYICIFAIGTFVWDTIFACNLSMLFLTRGGICPLCICPVVICCWAEGIVPILKVSGPPMDPDRIIPGSATEPCSTRPTRLNCCCKMVDLKTGERGRQEVHNEFHN